MVESLIEAAAHVGLSSTDVDVLRGITAFAGVDDAQLARLTRIMSTHRYDRNQLLFCQGDAAEYFYIVLEGWVRIFRSLPDGGEVTVSLFTRGESLAEAAIFAGSTYPVTGVTADISRLVLVSATGIRAALDDDPKLGLNMMASMSAKMQLLVRQLEQVSHSTTKQRVAAFLLTLADRQHTMDIRLPLDKHLIAARLGMQPETFSRALNKLKAEGVRTEGEIVHLSNLKRLKQVLGDHLGSMPS